MADIRKTMEIAVGMDASRAVNGFSALESRIGAVRGLLAGLGATAVLGFFAKTTQAAAEQADANKRLEISLSNLGIKYDDVSGRLDAIFTNIQNTTRFSDDKASAAFNKLVILTGTYEGALALLRPALDIAASGITDLESAATMLAKAAGGSPVALSRMGISIDSVKDKFDKANTNFERSVILADLISGKFGGQAAKSLETFSGKVDHMNNMWGEFLEKIGEKFLPIAETSISVLAQMGTIAGTFVYTFGGAAGAVAALKVAVSGLGTALSTLVVPAAFGGILKQLLDAVATPGRIQQQRSDVIEKTGLSGEQFDQLQFRAFKTGVAFDSLMQKFEMFRKQGESVSGAFRAIMSGANPLPPMMDEITISAEKSAVAIAKVDKELEKFRARVAAFAKMAATDRPFRNFIFQESGDWRGQPGFDAPPTRESVEEDIFTNWRKAGFDPDSGDDNLTRTKKGFSDLQRMALQFGSIFEGRLSAVFSKIRSLSDLTAFRIRDVFQALGDSILDMLTQIAAKMAVMGLLSLVTGIPFVGLMGFSGGGGGGAASVPVPVIPPGAARAPGSGGLGGVHVTVNVGRFIGIQEEAGMLAREISKQIRYGQSGV